MTCEPVSSRHEYHRPCHQAGSIRIVSAFTVAEIRRGLLDKTPGRKRQELERWFLGPGNLFAARILPFDEKAALLWARLMTEGKRRGRPRNPLDMIIAATAEANDCVIVTNNEKDSAGLKLLNPVRA